MNFYEFNRKLTKTFGDFYMSAKDEKPCTVCRNLTNRINIRYEQRVCSDQCRNILDAGLAKQERKDVGKIIKIARENNEKCNTCGLSGGDYCFFAYECLTNDYSCYLKGETIK